MSLYGRLKKAGPSGFGYNSTAEEVTAGLDLSGRAVLVTGCSSGLGLETARVLSLRGAHIVGLARTREKAAAALAGLPGEVTPVACELSEPASVREAAATVSGSCPPLAALIANAGIMALPERTVKYGLELQFLTNHVGHFLLVTGLLDRLEADGRVVMLSSSAHTGTYKEGVRLDDLDAAGGYTAWAAYGQSKLGNLLFARELARRLPSGQTSNALHPGVISTNLGRHMNPLVLSVFSTLGPLLALKSVPQGAATQCYVATHPSLAGTTGQYFADCNLAESSASGSDMALAAALWSKTEELVAGL
jgi:NAD(P)-dependent dehydrogenase (short-subunit alcohol dehydrogenase family)